MPAKNYRDTRTDKRFRIEAHYKLITDKERIELAKVSAVSKNYPPWTHSYVYTFNKNVKIYACLRRESRMTLYYANADLKCEPISDNVKIFSRKELIFLLPKQIRRKILIQTILE